MGSQRHRLLSNARREGLLVLATWSVFFAWVVGYSYTQGYASANPAQVKTVGGVPEWVWRGIVLPWFIATAVTIFFGLKVIADDDLGADRAGEKD